MLIASLCAIVVTMLLALARALLGPTVFDRILAANTFSTKTVLLIAVLGFFTDRPEFLDLALAYALINFVGAVAVLKFVRYGNFAQAEIEVETPQDSNEART
ncbi:MAG TPA: pH regulation protein F [Planctomycetaceae bacterium]|jgi:multicomponent Na+:H+ antiporter subunit F|nr:pH regulation protein F [Planctomycetaceae bacterium]HAA52565.1 pH regulation protein F [Planctomycetaceae bacterium]HCK53198.1 pH regulation protein F [Planctomycetaceae bacterium]|tara:strand:- start:250 stop:555 length:306 start_codon:yes stop_codon:yes gene_type:complete